MSDKQWKKIVSAQSEKDAEIIRKRDVARTEYNKLVEDGSIKKPTRIESLIKTANGHPDNQATIAARRVLEKRGID